MSLLILLIILMILGAVLALEVKDLISSVICIGIVGFSLVLIFLLLQAPDLALVQVVVETFSLIILIAAILKTTRRDLTEEGSRTRRLLLRGVGLLLILIILFFSYPVLGHLPPFGATNLRMAGPYFDLAWQKIGSANIVEAVILDLRGYDTLGEATILFAAAVGVLVVLRRHGLKKNRKKEGEEEE